MTDYVPDELLDDAEWHLESLREKNLPIDEINAFNHLAIFLRWCIERHLMGEAFTRDCPEALNDPRDLRGLIRDKLDGRLLRSMFNDEGFSFARYYYGDNDRAPYFPRDVDDYAFRWFGAKQYFSDEFQDEAYLFIPFDERYYEGLADVIQTRWDAWQNISQNAVDCGDPSPLAKAIINYLDCPCEYFPPLPDDDPLRAAYAYAVRDGMKEGFIPVLIAEDETLWETLILNSDSENDGAEDYRFTPGKVAEYRKRMLEMPVKNGSDVLDRLISDRHAEARDDDMDWDQEILGKMIGGEPIDHKAWWNGETNLRNCSKTSFNY